MNVLRSAREQKGWSQVKLACRVEVSSALMSDVERGARSTYPALRKKIARALGTDIKSLFDDRGFVREVDNGGDEPTE